MNAKQNMNKTFDVLYSHVVHRSTNKTQRCLTGVRMGSGAFIVVWSNDEVLCSQFDFYTVYFYQSIFFPIWFDYEESVGTKTFNLTKNFFLH